MATVIRVAVALVLFGACAADAQIPSTPVLPTDEEIEPRIIGTAGTTTVGFSGFVDRFFSPDETLPTNYTAQVEVGRFVTARWALRGAVVGSGSYGGDDAEPRAGSGAPALHLLGDALFYLTPRSMWSLYTGAGYVAQLTRRETPSSGSLVAKLGLEGAVSSRASLFIDSGFGRNLSTNDEGRRLLRVVGHVGVRLKM